MIFTREDRTVTIQKIYQLTKELEDTAIQPDTTDRQLKEYQWLLGKLKNQFEQVRDKHWFEDWPEAGLKALFD
jgi:hypothetical protein